MSPRLRVPDCTSRVATGPLPLSRRASMTTPLAGPSSAAFSSSTSACNRMASSRPSMSWSGLGRHFDELEVAAPFFRHDALGNQFLADALGIGIGFVDLVHRHHHGHARRLGVVDGFDRLRHHAVVRRHHQNHDVGRFRTACTHRGKRLVTRGVEEGDHASCGFHVIGADMLGDAAGFAAGHPGAADGSRAARSCRGRRGPSR